jgi:Fe-S cluster assembly protein SufD
MSLEPLRKNLGDLSASESRAKAEAARSTMSLPGLKTKNYQFFPVRSFETGATARDQSLSVIDWNEPEIQLASDLLSAPLTRLQTEGVTVSSLEEMFWEKGDSKFADDFFFQWIQESWKTGLVIRVKAGVQREETLKLNFSFSSPDSSAFRRIYYLEKGSRLSLVEDWDLLGQKEEAWLGSNLQIILEEGAQLDFQQVEHGAFAGTRMERHEAWLGEFSRLKFTQLPSGSKRHHCLSVFRLLGKKSQVDAKLAKLGDSNQLFQWGQSSFHEKEESFSNVEFYGVAKERSRMIFDALIDIPGNRPRSESHQLSKALLLSDNASVQAMPNLKIATDDVQVSHGASVSSFDEEQIYYLQSRGLSVEKARQMVVSAFVEPVVARIDHVELRKQILKGVRKWIRSGENSL